MRWNYPENSLWWVQQSLIHLSHMKYANHSSLTTCDWISDEMEVSRHLTLNSSAINNPSLVHSSRSVQHSKTVQFLKQFSFPSLFFFFGGPGEHLKAGIRKGLYRWGQFHCRSAVNHTISYTQSKMRSAQQDSPVSKTVFTFSSLFLMD